MTNSRGGVRMIFIPEQAGFSLIELLSATLLAGLLLVGAFRFLTTFTKTTGLSVKQSRSSVQHQKFLRMFHDQLSNAVSLHGDASRLANLSPMSLVEPPNCVDPDKAPALNTFLPSGLVPLPYQTAASLPDNIIAIDPSSATPSSAGDAVRFAYLDLETSWLPLADDNIANPGFPYITADPNPIVLASGASLSRGDYAVISDTRSSDLFRVTLASVTGRGLELTHAESMSIWNDDAHFSRNYGSNGAGAWVHKAHIVDYAYDPEAGQIVMDNHSKDDGFDAQSGAFFNPGVRTKSWQPVVTEVASFKLYYSVLTCDVATGKMIKDVTRTPRAMDPGETSSHAVNQVGYPALLNVRVEVVPTEIAEATGRFTALTKNKVVFEQTINPTSLTGEAENLNGIKKTIHGITNPAGWPMYSITPVSPTGNCPYGPPTETGS